MLETVLLCVLIAFFVFILAEFASYFWHRYMAHTTFFSILDDVVTAHRLHHQSTLDHDATEDFMWIVCSMVLVFLVFGLMYALVLYKYCNKYMILAGVISATASFFVNWYVHLSVHTKNHWMRGKFIEDISNIHMVHHEIPRRNYSIINFTDTLFGTYSCGFDMTLEEVDQRLTGKSGCD